MLDLQAAEQRCKLCLVATAASDLLMPCAHLAGPRGLSPVASLRPEPAVTISELEPAPAEDAEAAAARAAKGKALMRGVISKACRQHYTLVTLACVLPRTAPAHARRRMPRAMSRQPILVAGLHV